MHRERAWLLLECVRARGYYWGTMRGSVCVLGRVSDLTARRSEARVLVALGWG